MPIIDLVFLIGLATTTILRFREHTISRTNIALLSKRGFSIRENSTNRYYYPLIALWLSAALLEWNFQLIFIPLWIKILALIAWIAAITLRLCCISSLGQHWTIEIFAPEKVETPSLGPLTEQAMKSGVTEEVVTAIKNELFTERGPYKLVRHPAHLALIIELAALPLVGGALVTAIIFSIINNHFLNKLIDLEESWLFSRPGYHEIFYHKSRFIPF